MRKLSPFKAITHAVGSISTYRAVALRIGKAWLPILFIPALLEAWVGPPDPAKPQGAVVLIMLVSTAIGLIAFSSIAVSWHRFILRDETASAYRADATVLRYAGNSLLISAMVMLPMLVALLLAAAAPAASVFAVPLSLAAGTVFTCLSVKLPAVALGRKDFGFGDAWKVAEGNLWPLFGVFVLSGIVILFALLVVALGSEVCSAVSPALGTVFELVALPVMQIALALFNASVFTSLYGFFVERRDF